MVTTGLVVYGMAGTVFWVIEQRVSDPMLTIGLFSSPTFSSVTAVGPLINLGFYGELFVMSLYLQHLRGFTALRAGVALTPELAMAVIGSTTSGRVMAHTGPRRSMLAGIVVGGAGLVGLVVAGAHNSSWVLVVPLMASGLGKSLVMPAATAAVMEAAPSERGGLVAGTLNAARQVGGAVGVVLLGTHRATFVGGLRTGMVIAAGALVLAAVLTAFFVDQPIGPRRRRRRVPY